MYSTLSYMKVYHSIMDGHAEKMAYNN